MHQSPANKTAFRVFHVLLSAVLCAGVSVIAAPGQAHAVACAVDADCVDGDPCTLDLCVESSCTNPDAGLPDNDGDGICNDADNCIGNSNPGQEDADMDGKGDDCDNCPGDGDNDDDADGICEGSGFKAPKTADSDNCPLVANSDQIDSDADGRGDACDLCSLATGAAEDACLGTGVWETRTESPKSRGEAGLAALNSKIWIIGGEQTSIGREVRVYNMETDTYSFGPDLPFAPDTNQGRSHIQPVVVEGDIYLIGGLSTTFRDPISEVLMLDGGNTGLGWQPRAPMPGGARGAVGCAAHGTNIYCVGGVLPSESNPLPPTDRFEVYNTVSDSWTSLPASPRVRESANAHVIGDKLYVISGRNTGTNDTVPHTDIYDIATGTWSEGAAPPLARGGYASDVLEGRIIMMSGELGEGLGGNENGVLARVDEYNPVSDSWRSLTDIPTPRHGFMGVVSRAADGVRPLIYTITGGVAQGFSHSTTHEIFYFDTCLADADCNDDNVCTVDVCTGGVCGYTDNDGEICDDELFCNGADTCGAGTCSVHAGGACDDGVACTVDTCDEELDSCANTIDDLACDDGAFCNGAETCDAVLDCQAGTAPSTDDGVACTDDSCDEDTDSIVNVASDGNCDDGQFCNGTETCDAVLDCQAGTAPSTDDGVACTDDSCDEGADVIVNAVNNGNCDDGAFCNGAESCDAASGCQAGAAPSTDDGVACTDDSCDEDTDVIVNAVNDGNCDDGAFCNGAETCDAAIGCEAGEAPSTDDGVECTDDSCDEDTDVIVNAVNDGNCDDGAFCNGAESCDAAIGCEAGEAPSTDDGVECTDDSCDEDTDSIVNAVNDGNCDDGAFCNGAESCDAAIGCEAGEAPSTDDGVECTDDSCDEDTDSIVNAVNDGNCDDGAFCNGAETCDAAIGCEAGEAPSTDDGVECTDDSCDEDTDVIVNAVNDGNCDDGAFCNGAETCDAAIGCEAGEAPSTDDGVECTDDSCDEDTDSIVNAVNDGNCDDGAFCNGAETCDAASGCEAGEAPSTDDGVECTDDSCDEDTDSIVNAVNDGNCDDGAFCNGAETCDAGSGCQAGAAPSTDDGVACTDDSCDEDTDSIVNVASDGNCDDGAFCNGAETCNAAIGCEAATSPCDDGVTCTVDGCDEEADACSNAASDEACNDGSYCSGSEICDPTSGCISNDDAIDCADLDSQCAIGVCDDGIEGCDISVVNEGGACDDGLACTTDDLCTDGACLGLALCDPICERCSEDGEACMPLCGVPQTLGDAPMATDALYILKAAALLEECPVCLCDLDGSGMVSATDSLISLKLAVGLGGTLDCPLPAVEITTTTTITVSTTSTTLF